MYYVIEQLSLFMREYLREISMALAATILALYGSYINDVVKALLKQYHFVVRFMVFVMLCTFGYGAISYYFTQFVRLILGNLTAIWLAPVVILVFLGIGLLAEKKKKI